MRSRGSTTSGNGGAILFAPVRGLKSCRFLRSGHPVCSSSTVYDRGSGPTPMMLPGAHVFFATS